MKITKLTMTAALFVAIATFTVTSSNALTSIQVQEIKKTVLGVPVPEMPAKAAELVTRAEKKDRQAVAVTAVRAVVLKHRAAAPIVISAISKAAPEVAPAVAVAAAEVATEQAPMIARAAAASAPAHAAEITTAVSQAVPSQATTVAATVSAINVRPTVTPTVATRGAASSGGTSGIITTSPKPINENNQNFPFQAPTPASDPVIIYNTPPAP